MATIRLDNLNPEDRQEIRKKTSKSILWVAMGTIAMLFSGFLSAYIVRQEEGQWMEFALPTEFFYSTVILLVSSVTMWWATNSAKHNRYGGIKWGLLATLVLGIAFSVTQYIAWGTLYDQTIVFAGSQSNAAGSYLYVITAIHLVHLFGGILSLIYTFAQSLRRKYHSENKLGLELCAIYWHFLDVLWVILFLFLYNVR
ncbi:cytochrome c oxidase subunit 3 [bacterium SCSIO 12741]|nr:cytochrome c oxidase subunit 3 [bacterium SCSIO 12741]